MDFSFALIGSGIEKEMKPDSKTDISIYSRRLGDDIITAILPGEKLSSLIFSIQLSDYMVLQLPELTRESAEAVLASEALRKQGVFAGSCWNRDVIKGTAVYGWKEVDSSLISVADMLSSMNIPNSPEAVFIDQSFSVKGVGRVVLGFMKSIHVSKHDELLMYGPGTGPEKAIVKSIQRHSREIQEAELGMRIGFSIKSSVVPERGWVMAKHEIPMAERFLLEPNQLAEKMMKSGALPSQIMLSVGPMMSPAKISGNEIIAEKRLPAWEGLAFSNDTSPGVLGRAVPEKK